MAVQATPYVVTALSHSAELFRREMQAGLPFGSAGGVIPATPTTSANATAGVAGCSDLQVTAPVSGMSVNISAGQVLIPGSLGSGVGYGIGKGYGMPTVTLNGGAAPTVSATAAAVQVQLTTQGCYYAYNDNSAGAVNLAIAAANASNPRLDVVVAQLEDAAYSGSNNDWKLAVITGTAAASPTVPALPASTVVLAYVWVPAAATNIVSADILDLRVAYNRNPYRSEMFRTAAWTATTTDTTVVFDTAAFDLTGSCNLSTGTFTCPVSGLYAFDTGAAASANTLTLIRFTKNGALFRQPWNVIGTTIAANAANGSTKMLCNLGDTVTVTVRNSTASSAMGTGQAVTFFSAVLLSAA